MKYRALILPLVLFMAIAGRAQTANELLDGIRKKLGQVNDYEARGTMKTNVTFVKAPVASVVIYFKKPDKLKIRNESGISLVPKGSVNISFNKIVANSENCDIIDVGKEEKTGLRIIKLLPKEENADIVLSTLYIDEKNLLVKRSTTTTRETGTYELEMTYGKHAAYGLADKVVFTFNTREYKLPKGVTFDYDNGSGKPPGQGGVPATKGRVEINYSTYVINKGVPDSVFQ